MQLQLPQTGLETPSVQSAADHIILKLLFYSTFFERYNNFLIFTQLFFLFQLYYLLVAHHFLVI